MGEINGAPDQILLIVLSGAVIHGLWLAFLLIFKTRYQAANRFLALALITVSLHLINYLFFLTGFIRILPHALGVIYPFLYLL